MFEIVRFSLLVIFSKMITNIILVPDNIRETLTTRYEYVVAEKEVIPDLTDAVRLCGTCQEWCPT
jgi:epoxyqueuosine reductase QueG